MAEEYKPVVHAVDMCDRLNIPYILLTKIYLQKSRNGDEEKFNEFY